MRTYIINLKESTVRKKYMEDLLAPLANYLDWEFIEAFDGRNLDKNDIERIFNQDKAFSTYGRYLKGGEIGCTISHRICYESIINNNEPYALILEDDLVWNRDDIVDVISIAEKILKHNKPIALLLSGDYWYYSKKSITDIYSIASVREAVCTQAYFINISAARCLLQKEKYYLADDWYGISKSGVKLYAMYPHVADQNRREFQTEISMEYAGVNRKNMSLFKMIHSYYRACVKYILLFIYG